MQRSLKGDGDLKGGERRIPCILWKNPWDKAVTSMGQSRSMEAQGGFENQSRCGWVSVAADSQEDQTRKSLEALDLAVEGL